MLQRGGQDDGRKDEYSFGKEICFQAIQTYQRERDMVKTADLLYCCYYNYYLLMKEKKKQERKKKETNQSTLSNLAFRIP